MSELISDSTDFAIQGISLATYSASGYDDSTIANYEAEAVSSGANYVALSNESYVNLTTGIISDAYNGAIDMTASLASVDAAVKSAEAQGLSVMLKPQIVTTDAAYSQYTSGPYINLVDPSLVITDPATFFSNYKAYILQWAELAQKDHVAVLSIGNEMVAATKPQYTPYWDDIISSIRGVYSGQLTYSALLPLQTDSSTNEVSQIGFWGKLDFAGFDVYPSLSQGGADPSVASLNAAWQSETVYGTVQDYQAFVSQLAAKVGIPVVFTETGLPSFSGASDRQTTSDGDIGSATANGSGVVENDAEQANWWESFFETWAVNPPTWLKGVFVYNNDPGQLGSYAATNYNVIGKSAAGVIAAWYGGKTTVNPLSDVFNGSQANDRLYLFGAHQTGSVDIGVKQAPTLDTVVSINVTSAIENGSSPGFDVVINGIDFGTVAVSPISSGYVTAQGISYSTNQVYTFDIPGLVSISSLQVSYVGPNDPTHEFNSFFNAVSVDGVALTNATYTPSAQYGDSQQQVLPDSSGNGGSVSQWGGGYTSFDATPWNAALSARTAGSPGDPYQVNGEGGTDTLYVLGTINDYSLRQNTAGSYSLSESAGLGQNTVLTGISYLEFQDGSEIAVTSGGIPTAQQIVGTIVGQTVTDQTSLSPFTMVTVTDPNLTGMETLTITVNSAGGAPTDQNGVLTGAGLQKVGVGTYTLTGSATAVTASLEALSFTPTAHQVAPGQEVVTQFNVSVTDGILSGSSGSTSVIATAVDDQPGIVGTLGGQFTNDEAAIHPFASVVISDPDFGSVETVTIKVEDHLGLVTDADGQLSGTGLEKTGTGTYVLFGSPAAVSLALDGVAFTPTAHQVAPGGSISSQLVLSVTDGTLSISDTSTSVTATALDDQPTLTGVSAHETATDVTTIHPFSGVVIGDPDYGSTETVTISVENATGALTDVDGLLTGVGLSKVGVGTYSLTGKPAAVSNALDALLFTPTAHQVSAGQSVTSLFELSVTDGTASSPQATTTLVTTATALPVTNIASGTLLITTSSMLSTSNGVSIAAGASLDISGAHGVITVGQLSGASGSHVYLGNSGINVDETSAATFGGVISDGGHSGGSGGSLMLSGPGYLSLTAANTYTGVTTIDGLLSLAQVGSIAPSAGVSLGQSGAALDISEASISESIKKLSGVAGSHIFLGGNVLETVESAAASYSGIISDGGLSGKAGGSLIVTGSGDLDLTGPNTFSGGTGVISGTLELGTNNAGGANGILLDGSATLKLDSSALILNASGSQTLATPLSIAGSNNLIDLTGLAYSSHLTEHTSGSMVDLTEGSLSFALGITDSAELNHISLIADGHGGTDVSLSSSHAAISLTLLDQTGGIEKYLTLLSH